MTRRSCHQASDRTEPGRPVGCVFPSSPMVSIPPQLGLLSTAMANRAQHKTEESPGVQNDSCLNFSWLHLVEPSSPSAGTSTQSSGSGAAEPLDSLLLFEGDEVQPG